MNWLVNLGAKLAGISKVWDWLDGKKTYLAGSLQLLSGTVAIGSEVLKLIADRNPAEVLAWAKQLPTDAGVAAFAMGLGVLGLRHAVAKTDPATKPAA